MKTVKNILTLVLSLLVVMLVSNTSIAQVNPISGVDAGHRQGCFPQKTAPQKTIITEDDLKGTNPKTITRQNSVQVKFKSKTSGKIVKPVTSSAIVIQGTELSTKNNILSNLEGRNITVPVTVPAGSNMPKCNHCYNPNEIRNDYITKPIVDDDHLKTKHSKTGNKVRKRAATIKKITTNKKSNK
jgi:hypothetical protein